MAHRDKHGWRVYSEGEAQDVIKTIQSFKTEEPLSKVEIPKRAKIKSKPKKISKKNLEIQQITAELLKNPSTRKLVIEEFLKHEDARKQMIALLVQEVFL